MSTNQPKKSITLAPPEELWNFNLLIKDPNAIAFYPSVAERIGLNEAILLTKLEFLLNESTVEVEGYKWIRKTYAEWRKVLPMWSEDMFKRILLKLEKEGFIIATTDYNKVLFDNTKWYRINYDKVEEEFY